MMRILVILAAGISGAMLVLPLLAFGQAKDSQQPTASAKSEAAQKLRAFLDADWQRWMQDYPEVATYVGYPGQNDRWTDGSPAGLERRQRSEEHTSELQSP